MNVVSRNISSFNLNFTFVFFVGSVLLIVLITIYNFIKRKKDVLNYRTLVVFSDLSLVKVNTYFMC